MYCTSQCKIFAIQYIIIFEWKKYESNNYLKCYVCKVTAHRTYCTVCSGLEGTEKMVNHVGVAVSLDLSSIVSNVILG